MPVQASAVRTKGRLKVGVIAAASLLVGGLAAAWWYRKTLKTLRQTAENGQNPHFRITKNDNPYDL
jgi:hypothetical protein